MLSIVSDGDDGIMVPSCLRLLRIEGDHHGEQALSFTSHERGEQLVYDGTAHHVCLICEVGGERRARAFQNVAIRLFEPALVVRA